MIWDQRINELLGAASHIHQFSIAAMASTKDAAIEIYAAAGLSTIGTAHYLRVKTGNDVDSLIQAGVLTDDGRVMVWHRGGVGGPVVALAAGHEPKIVAHFGETIPGTYTRGVVPAPTQADAAPTSDPTTAEQRQRNLDLRILEALRDELPHGHADKAGIIRAIEVLRYEPLDPFETPARGTAADADREQA